MKKEAKNLKIAEQLAKIMLMVRMNSQLVLLQGLLINSMDYKPIFVQLVHNTDDDGLLMFFVRDFSGFEDYRNEGKGVEVRVVELCRVEHPIWKMIFNRFG